MVSIPQKVFDIYHEFGDEMINAFGVNCRAVFLKKVEVSSSSLPSTKVSKSLRPYGKTESFSQNQNYTTVETTEDFKLRVYFTRKEFQKIADLSIPDGGMMTIGYLTDLPKISACKYLIPNTSNEAYLGAKFEKVENPIPWGIKKDRYFVCGWKRV